MFQSRKGRALFHALLAFWLPLGAAGAQSTFRFQVDGPSQLFTQTDTFTTGSYLVNLVSSGSGPGAHAWCLALRPENGRITAISIDGTDAMSAMTKGMGFHTTELTKGPGNEGAISCVVLSTANPVELPMNSTKSIARLDLQVGPNNVCGPKAKVLAADSLRSSEGAQTKNTVTAGGVVHQPLFTPKIADLVPLRGNCRNPNPNGDILTGSWNLLFPLTNPKGCSGGGPETMRENWLGRTFTEQTPVAGDEWNIAFQEEAAAVGFEAGHFFSALGLSGRAVWTSLSFLSAITEGLIASSPGCDVPAHFDCAVTDYRALIDRLNVLSQDLGIPRITADNTLGIAQTYVLNQTRGGVCVDVCLSSDDSGQVWINDKVVINASACRGIDNECQNLGEAILDPGLNQITVLCWQGVGDWRFQLFLRDPVTGLKLGNSNQDELLFTGTDPGTLAPHSSIQVARIVENPDCCPAANPARVRLLGTGPGTGSVSILERYPGAAPGLIANVSAGGVVTNPEGGPEIRWNVQASVLRSPGLTYSINLPPGSTATPEGLVVGCDPITGAREVKGSWPHTGSRGLFDDSHDVGSAADLASGPGSFTAQPGPDGVLGTADDLYTIRGSGVDIWDGGDSFHFAYKRVTGDFTATVRVTNRVFPAAGGRWGRYGLMARRDCSPVSKYSLVYANLEADPGPGADHPRGDSVFYQFRRNHGSAAPNSNTGFVFPDPDGGGGPQLINQPNFFRLVRRGQVFTGYASFDGVSWKLIGSDTWYEPPPDDEVLLGFVHSRHSSATSAGSVTFTNFRCEPPPRNPRFDNDAGSAGTLLFRSGFDNLADGSLPPRFRVNCGTNCGAFTPRVIGGRLRLTQEGITGNSGSAFLEIPVPLRQGAVVVEYTVFLSHSGVTRQPPAGDPNPGDGLTMTIVGGRNTQRIGAGGGGLGYENIASSFDGAAPSFAVEADTWSGDFFNEGTGAPLNDGAWHIGIDSGGSVHCVALNSTSDLPDIFRPEGVRHRVVYTADGRVTVHLLPEGGGAGIEDEEPVVEAEVEPVDAEAPDGTVGFTAATGGATQTAEIDDVEVTVITCSDIGERAVITGPTTAAPETMVILDAGSSDAGSGDGGESLVFSWSVSGDAILQGPSDQPVVTLLMGCPVGDGEAIGRLEVNDLHCATPLSAMKEHKITITRGGNWMTYDATDDGQLNIADAVNHLNFLFAGGATPKCREALDFDGNGEENIADPVAELTFLFSGGQPPARGEGCQAYGSCATSVNCP